MIVNGVEWPKWKVILGLYPPRDGGGGGDSDSDSGEGPSTVDEDYDETEDAVGVDTEFGGLEPLPAFIPPKVALDYRNREFSSWSEFIESVTDDSLCAWKSKRSSHRLDRGGDFTGTETWDEAVALARSGWPEGRKLLSESLVLVAPKPEPYRSIELSVAGAFPMVPNYCAGDPECMVIDPGSDFRHSKPIVRIDYCVGGTVGVAAKAMMLRGAAVVSLADTLEHRGFSTELRIIHTDRGRDGKVLRWHVVFKKAGEQLDIDRAAFALAHPSTFRRFGFAITEQHAELEEHWRFGYGSSVSQPIDDDPSIVFIPGANHRETPESAQAAVASAAEAILNELHEAEELEREHD